MTRLTQASTDSAVPIAEKRVDYAYDAASQLATITRFADLSGTTFVAETSHNYDGAGRLTDLDHSNSGTFQFSSDGILLLAYSLGIGGQGLEPFRVGNARTGAEIETVLTQLADAVDFDGNGVFQFASDGIILLADALGTGGSGLELFRGNNASRSGAQIALRLDQLLPSAARRSRPTMQWHLENSEVQGV